MKKSLKRIYNFVSLNTFQRFIKIFFPILAILMIFLSYQTASSSFYAGAIRTIHAIGGKAHISAPQNAFPTTWGGGISNWVSSVDSSNGKLTWIQSGWMFSVNWASKPIEYVEWCIDCSGQSPIYKMNDKWSNQYVYQEWGTTVQYEVNQEYAGDWCGYIKDRQLQACYLIYNGNPVTIEAFSEVHDSDLNPLNTYFSDVNYKDINGQWMLFDNNIALMQNAPYRIAYVYPFSFHTYRSSTVFLSIVNK